MNLGTQKWKKARANFSGVRDDAGRCGTACTRACPWDAHCLPACSGEITSFSKKPSFLGNHPKYVGKQQPRPWPRPRHASKAKAKACSEGQGQGMQPRQQQPPMGMQQPRPRQPPWAGSEGQGMLACVHAAKAKPRHAAKAMACLRGHAGMPLGAGRWARWHAPGRRQQQGPSMPRGRGRGMPRGWDAKAVACPWDPYKAMAALGGAAAAKPR